MSNDPVSDFLNKFKSNRHDRRTVDTAAQKAVSKATKYDQHNILLADVKAEILTQVYELLKKLGYSIITINPGGHHQHIVGAPSNINLFEMAIMAAKSKDPALRARTISFVDEAIEIFVNIMEDSKDQKFFKYGGFDAFKGVLFYLIFKNPGKATPSQVFRILSNAKETRRCLQELMRILPANLDEATLLNDAKRFASSVLDVDKAKKSYLPTFVRETMPKLGVFSESGLLANLGEFATSKLSDVRTKERVAVVIMTPLDQIKYMAPMTALIVMNVFQAIQVFADGFRVHIIADECPALCIPNLNEHANTIRGLRGSMELYGTSEIAFIDSYTEPKYKQIRANCGVSTFGRPNTYEEAEVLSKSFGMKVEKTLSGNYQNVTYEDVTTNIAEHEVPRYTASELMALEDDEMVAKIGNLPPFIIKRIMTWEIEGLREELGENPLEGPPPEVEARLGLNIEKSGVELVWPKSDTNPEDDGELKIKRAPMLRPAYFLWAYAWMAIFSVPYVMPSIDGPHIYFGDIKSGTGSGRRVACEYISLSGEESTLWADFCPLVLFEKPGRP